jgi:hypothetical protein
MTKRESTASCKTLESWRSVQSSYFFSYSQILCKISPQLFVQDISCHARGTCTRPNNFTALWRRLFIHLLIGIGCKKDVDGGHVFIKFSWPFEMKTLIHLLIGIGCKKDVDGTVFLSKFFLSKSTIWKEKIFEHVCVVLHERAYYLFKWRQQTTLSFLLLVPTTKLNDKGYDVLHSSLESSVDKGSCANVMEDGMVAPVSLFAWLISHQPAVLFSQNKSVTSKQPTVLFSQHKSAPAKRTCWKAGLGNDDSPSEHTVDEEVELISNGVGVKQQSETSGAARGHESSTESTLSTDKTSTAHESTFREKLMNPLFGRSSWIHYKMNEFTSKKRLKGQIKTLYYNCIMHCLITK